MRTITATAASRAFSELLDSVARGDVITVTRGGHPVAEIRPVRRHTMRDLRERLSTAPRLDPEFEADVAAGLALIASDEIKDPWVDA